MSLALCTVSSCPCRDANPSDTDSLCNAKTKASEALRKYFHFKDFKPGQLEAILPVLHKRDVFVRMATGAGKTLCIFIPPLAISSSAIGVVISPLVGLMEQQINQLSRIGVNAIRIDSPQECKKIRSGSYRFVFVSPELAGCHSFHEALKDPMIKKNIALLAVDEAHCIKEWGKDFRVAFSKLGGLRAFTDAPFMALTASAPSDVQAVIVHSLQLRNPIILSRSLDRPNIFISVKSLKALNLGLTTVIESLKSVNPLSIPKTIVFTQTKNAACKVYSFLRTHAIKKEYIGMYHASLTHTTKAYVQEKFSGASHLRCLVATIAFGMGMDIPDVQDVFIYGVPDDICQLYQLCGRAGRNGSTSSAVVLFGHKHKFKSPVVEAFCKSKENCRRKTLVQAVGCDNYQTSDRCCDVCNPALDLSAACIPREKRKRRTAIRKLSTDHTKNLKKRLEEERETIVRENPHYYMLGLEHVCSNYIINELCDNVKFYSSKNDITLFGIVPKFKDRILDVVFDFVSEIPCSKRARHR